MTSFEPGRARSRSVQGLSSIAVVVVLIGAIAGANALLRQPPAPDAGGSAQPTVAAPEMPWAAPAPTPDADVIALADRMRLTSQGRELFYSTQPRLVGAAEIEAACAGAVDASDPDWFTGGCFIGAAQPQADRIVVYLPPDDRLWESMVSVAAHELLHAVYARLDPLERARVDSLVSEATALVPRADRVHEQIDRSVGDDESKRANEQFAYLGSQVMVSGGFAAELEELYGRYLSDRRTLVDTHVRARAVVTDAIAAADAAWSAVAALESDHARARAQLEADRSGLDAAAAAHRQDVERFDATAPEERARWEVTLQPPGEAPMTMSWGESLAYRAEELDRYRADLEARDATLTAAEAEAEARRADAERQREDALSLLRAANPNAAD